MDLDSCVEATVTPFSIKNNGTERITESHLNTEDSKDSTICDIKIDTLHTKVKLSTTLIDKSFSIDEDELCTPLEPTQVGLYYLTPSSNGDTPEETTSSDEDAIENILHVDVYKTCLGERPEKIIEDKLEISRHTLNDFKKKVSDISIIEEEDEPKVPTIFEESESDDSSSKDSSLPDTPHSILRKSSLFESSLEGDVSPSTRHVFFPTEEKVLVSYREPEYSYPWIINDFMTSEEILQVYQQSCKRHKTIELDAIKSQIRDIKNNMNHSATLKLCAIKITQDVNETLEDILKVTNFHTLILQECQFTTETMTEFLNILEYYKSVCHFEIAMGFEDDDTWKYFCMACSNIMVLESLSFKGLVISEHYMRHLMNTIKNNSNITVLRFDSCMLVKLPSFYLVEALMTNRTIRELYLPSTGLYTKEAEALQRFLVNNKHLKVLDISNNNLGDRGLEMLAKGLCSQTTPGTGLSVLVIFNNQITEKSGAVIKNLIIECKNLHTLNIGYNNLTDDVLYHISDGLPYTQSLQGLGLQCTLLTCKGILALSKAIPRNSSLQKINLKGNKAIRIVGIETLCNALTNSKIVKIKIDDNNRSCSDPEAYSQLVKKLNAICTVNKTFADDSSDDDEEVLNISQKNGRKVSLSCEPKYEAPDPSRSFQIGSPLPSPSPSPAPRSRFQIVKIKENEKVEPPTPIRAAKSRFKVTKVLPSPDEDLNLGRFANIRSSVSSTDSLDSLTTMNLDSDSEC